MLFSTAYDKVQSKKAWKVQRAFGTIGKSG